MSEFFNSIHTGGYNIDPNDYFSYNIELWYPILKDFTFETQFLTLLPEEASILATFDIDNNDNLPSIVPTLIFDIDQLFADDSFPHLITNGAVVGVSSRCIDNTTIPLEYDVFHSLLSNGQNESIAIYNTAHLNRRFFNGKDTVFTLLRDQRIREDLQMTINYNKFLEETENQSFNLSIILRQWEPSLQLQYEFRLFVYHNKLTGISQRWIQCYFPEMLEQKNKLKLAITHFFAEVLKSKLSEFYNYIVDICCFPDEKSPHSFRIMVVDLNPFFDITDSLLFDWHDEEINLSGQGPLLFHTLDIGYQNNVIYNIIPITWRESLGVLNSSVPCRKSSLKFTPFAEFGVKAEFLRADSLPDIPPTDSCQNLDIDEYYKSLLNLDIDPNNEDDLPPPPPPESELEPEIDKKYNV